MAVASTNGPICDPDINLAARMLELLRDATRDGAGVTRAAYGAGEQLAHDMVKEEAVRMGLDVAIDATGNLYVTMRGSDPNAKTVIIGSHMDSVPIGGNYDGAAGVIAGLAVLSGWHRAGFRPRSNVAVMAIRAEESNWFPYSYIGSKGALGLLPSEALDVQRSDTGRSLRDHMFEAGFDPDSVAAGVAHVKTGETLAYIELHIEQGPVLIGADRPVSLVTGIRGSFRYRHARIIGEYAHSGAVPRAFRRDAVSAASELVTRLNAEWVAMEADGADLTFTVGIFSTDPVQHAFSKIAGEVSLSIDVRSHVPDFLEDMHERLTRCARETARKYNVTVELGPKTASQPALMDESILTTFRKSMSDLGLDSFEMASGAGHDAAVFANAGIPTIMLFVRNQNGSHNPDEAMEMDDFRLAINLLAAGVERLVD
ncbi:Zn-dependent hydrolase [Mesorhizobium sp. WSM4887]|uniref:Zn-dependent hydrolase n=1 Tax=Mesorhizobium sp. WSM4887 TaxID=3038543 RepID=UPI002417B8B7|nr:Zn-dependent hydrolase [Mesorhizobium sp. WSM4887]MDG4889810.1 Zn-dependent hydrolase [Mesorhizobium sp. WSM4887]